jgi:hypothetical protein
MNNAVQSVKDSVIDLVKNKVSFTANAGAALGSGINTEAQKGIYNVGDSLAAGLVKGYGAFAGAMANVDILKRGDISGLKQGFSLEAGEGLAVGIKFEYGVQQRPIPYNLTISAGAGAGMKYDYTSLGYQKNLP